MNNQISFSFTSQLLEMKKVLQYILIFLQNELPAIEDEDLSDLRLIYSELLANAVIHGNKEDPSKKVELFVELDQRDIKSVIRDEGNGFDHLVMMERAVGSDDIYDESGRGIKLVGYLTDYLGFNETGNEIKFVKRMR